MNKIHLYKKDVEVGGLSSGATTTSRRMYCSLEWDIHWPGQDRHMTQNSSLADCKRCLISLAKEGKVLNEYVDSKRKVFISTEYNSNVTSTFI